VYYRYWMHLSGHHIPGHYGVRTDRHKLVFIHGLALDSSGSIDKPTPVGWELYDLQNDPKEVHNVYNHSEYKDVSKKLKLELLRLKDEYGDSDEAYPELKKVVAEHWE
jgi:hypothetical protein